MHAHLQTWKLKFAFSALSGPFCCGRSHKPYGKLCVVKGLKALVFVLGLAPYSLRFSLVEQQCLVNGVWLLHEDRSLSLVLSVFTCLPESVLTYSPVFTYSLPDSPGLPSVSFIPCFTVFMISGFSCVQSL